MREHLVRDSDAVAEQFVGPLVLTLDKVAEAAQLADGHHLDVNVVGPVDAVDTLEKLMTSLDNVTVTGAEFKLGEEYEHTVDSGISRAVEFKAAHPEVDVYLELPFAEVTDTSLGRLAEGNVNLKFRTGGVRQELFPTPQQVVTVIEKALAHDLRFKFTAGLHRAMRYRDGETGFQHFGFANIAATIDALQRGASHQQALEILESDDTSAVIDRVADTDSQWRKAFVSFGTCSVPEPTETLKDLGLMRPETFERLVIDN